MSEVEPIKGNPSEESDFVAELNRLNLKWSEESFQLRSLAKMLVAPQPFLIYKGQFDEWGVDAIFFALCARSKISLIAQYTSFSPEGKLKSGSEFYIDDDFDGWFEILSEDGYEMFRHRRVSEIADYPGETFAVMKKMQVLKYHDNGDMEAWQLNVGDEITVASVQDAHIVEPGYKGGRLLTCKSPKSGGTFYLHMDQVGEFSKAGQDSIAGPQTISSLFSLEFPINVKLLTGSPPPSDSEDYFPTLQILGADSEEVLTVWSLKKDEWFDIPVDLPLLVKLLENSSAVNRSPVYEEALIRTQSVKAMVKKRDLTNSDYQQHPYHPDPDPSSESIPLQQNQHQPSTSKSHLQQSSTTLEPQVLITGRYRNPWIISVRPTLPSNIHRTSTPYNPAFTPRYQYPISNFNVTRFPHTGENTSGSLNLTTTNYQRPATTCVQQSNEVQTYFNPPSYSVSHGPSPMNYISQMVSKYLPELSISPKSLTFEDYKYRNEFSLTAPCKNAERLVQMETPESVIEQRLSFPASVPSVKVSHFNVDPLQVRDGPHISSGNTSQKSKFRSEPRDEIDCSEESNLQQSNHRPLRIQTPKEGDEPTSDLSDVKAISKGLVARRSPRIQLRKDSVIPLYQQSVLGSRLKLTSSANDPSRDNTPLRLTATNIQRTSNLDSPNTAPAFVQQSTESKTDFNLSGPESPSSMNYHSQLLTSKYSSELPISPKSDTTKGKKFQNASDLHASRINTDLSAGMESAEACIDQRASDHAPVPSVEVTSFNIDPLQVRDGPHTSSGKTLQVIEPREEVDYAEESNHQQSNRRPLRVETPKEKDEPTSDLSDVKPLSKGRVESQTKKLIRRSPRLLLRPYQEPSTRRRVTEDIGHPLTFSQATVQSNSAQRIMESLQNDDQPTTFLPSEVVGPLETDL